MLRPAGLLLATSFMVACATREKSVPTLTQPNSEQPQAQLAAESKPTRIKREPPAPKTKSPGPIPTRALNIESECRFRDETGYGGTLRLSVREAQVQAFEAAVVIPRRGICRFDLKSFRQTRDLPTVELNHLRDPCIVRLWEQGERVTIAFHQCQKMCSGSAWDHLWPILNDRRNGSCA